MLTLVAESMPKLRASMSRRVTPVTSGGLGTSTGRTPMSVTFMPCTVTKDALMLMLPLTVTLAPSAGRMTTFAPPVLVASRLRVWPAYVPPAAWTTSPAAAA